jgi:hypothetical protein
VLAAVAVGTWTAPPSLASTPYPEQSFVPATSARGFGDSVGVNVRLSWIDTPYGDFDTVRARLHELGVRHINDGFCAACEYQLDRMRRLAADGIKSSIGPSGLTEGSAALQRSLQVIRDRVREAVDSVQAPNEPDISGDPQWVEHTRAYQAELYARVKGDPALAHLPVIGPSIVNREARPLLGDLSAFLDRGNLHPYPGGTPPLSDIADQRLIGAIIAGNKPLVATEAGYHNDLSYMGPHRAASERATAIYTPRLVLEAFLSGIERTYIYQLLDPWTPVQAQARGIPPWQNSFGLLRWNLSPKPSFFALRNLMRAVDSGSAPVVSPGGLRFGLAGAGPDVRNLVLRSADGSYALVLWRQVSVWDRDALRDLYPAADQLEVVLGEPVSLARRFDPVDSDAERQRWTDPQVIPVDLAGAPVVLRLTPPGAPIPGERPRMLRVRPKLSSTRKRQRLRRYVVLKVRCAAPCASVSAKGRLVVKKSKRRRLFKLAPARKRAVGGTVTLRLRIPKAGRRAASRALRRGGRVSAQVTVTARSATGAKLGTARTRIVLGRRSS